MFSIKCPNCGSVNEASAAMCRCGYDLTQGLRLAPGSDVVSHPSIKQPAVATDLPFDYRGRAGRREFLLVNLGPAAAFFAIVFAAGMVEEVRGKAGDVYLNVSLCGPTPLRTWREASMAPGEYSPFALGQS